MGLDSILSTLHEYRVLLAAVDVGAMGVGGVASLWNLDQAPPHHRSAYVIMSLYCLAAAAAGGYGLFRFLTGG